MKYKKISVKGEIHRKLFLLRIEKGYRSISQLLEILLKEWEECKKKK